MAVVGSTVYLHSTNTENLREDKSQQDSSVESASQKDLQLLAQILQEHLRAEIPSGEFFLVRCVSKQKQTMILVEHPEGLIVNTQETFKVLEEGLESELNLPQHHTCVQLFLRTVGTKLPYGQRSLKLKVGESSNSDNPPNNSPNIDEEGNEEPIPNTFSTSFPSLTSSSPISSEEDLEISGRDSSTNGSQTQTLTSPLSSKQKLSRKGIFMAGMLGFIGIFGTAGYFLSSPCILSKCSQIQGAQLLTQTSPLLARGVASESDLVVQKQKLNVAITSLEKIPRISPYHKQANELTRNLSQKSAQIEQVLQAFQKAKQAIEVSQSKINNLSELQTRQQLWRNAITLLETINPKSELYNLVQPKLARYRTNLKAVNQQLLAEEKWLKKIKDASSVAEVATLRETKANSLPDLQKVQSTWKIVVNALKPIPKTSVAYLEAQQHLAQYQPKLVVARRRTNQELLAAKSYEQIINATNQAKNYEQNNQLQLAVAYWKRALNTTQNIATDTSYSQKAQSLVEPLTEALEKAQQKLQTYKDLDKTRNDLENTCSGEVQVCEYTFNRRQIVVRITYEYEKALEQRLIDASTQGNSEPIASVNSHLQRLQQALEAISINAKSSLLVYDSQGNVIQESKIN